MAAQQRLVNSCWLGSAPEEAIDNASLPLPPLAFKTSVPATCTRLSKATLQAGTFAEKGRIRGTSVAAYDWNIDGLNVRTGQLVHELVELLGPALHGLRLQLSRALYAFTEQSTW